MTSNIESGILAYLTTALAGGDTTYGSGDEAMTITAATINSETVQLLAVTSSAKAAERLPKIVVMSDETEIEAADATQQLWKTKLELMIGTPRRAAEWTVDDHKAFAAAVRALFTPATKAAITTALATVGITDCNGWFFAGMRDAHSDGNWITIISFEPFSFSVSLA